MEQLSISSGILKTVSLGNRFKDVLRQSSLEMPQTNCPMTQLSYPKSKDASSTTQQKLTNLSVILMCINSQNTAVCSGISY